MIRKILLTLVFAASFAFAGPCCNKGDMNNTRACDTNVTVAKCNLGKNCPCGAECKCGNNCKCKPMQKSKKGMACQAKAAKACGSTKGIGCGMNGMNGMGAGACNSGGCMSMVAFPRFIAAELELTKAQNEKIDEISKKYAAKMAETPKGCEAKPLSFVKDSKFDKEAFIAKHNEATANMGKLKAEMFEEIFALLSDKQKKEMSDILNFKK